MKYLGWIVAAAVVTLALAGDPTCPSDIDDNGTVGTTDLLQLLSDWGPCPTPPRVISIESSLGAGRVLRLWSDGRIECGVVSAAAPCSPILDPPWAEIPNDPPFPPDVRIVEIGGTVNGDIVFRLWSDGTIEWNRVLAGGFCGNPDSTWCGWQVVPDLP